MSGGVRQMARVRQVAKAKTIELKRVVVTGIGVISPVGFGKQAFLESLVAGRSGVKTISRFDPAEYPVKIAAEVRGFDPAAFMDRKMARRMDRYAQYGVAAASQALEDSNTVKNRQALGDYFMSVGDFSQALPE